MRRFGGLGGGRIHARHGHDTRAARASCRPQIRYAHYFEELLRRVRAAGPDADPPPTAQDLSPAVELLRLRLHAVPRLGDGGAGLAVEVLSDASECAETGRDRAGPKTERRV